MEKKYFDYEDKVIIKSGKFKGKKGEVRQEMPNGLIGVALQNGQYIYFNKKSLRNITED